MSIWLCDLSRFARNLYLFDINGSVQISKQLTIKASLNNLTDNQYFTKRPLFYPGVGIWSSDGRNGTISFIIKL